MTDTRKKAHGRTSLERILFAGMFAQGVDGRRGLTYCMVGKPGAAKTSMAKSLATYGGLHFKSVVSSLRDPSDFLGLGVPMRMPITSANAHLDPDCTGDLMMMKYAPANFAIECAVAGRSLLLLDEVNTAPPAVQAALLRLLFEGVCGELTLPPGVRMMLAMNEIDDAAGGWDIAPPLANRIGWLQAPNPEPHRWIEWLMSQGGAQTQPLDPIQEEAEVDALWAEAWAKAAGQVAGFIQAKGDMLHKMPPHGNKGVSGAWPSPRTWELATRAKAASFIYDLSPKEADESLSAFVGNGAAGEFHTWVKHNDLPDPADFLDGKIPFQHDKRRLDRTAAVITAATSLVTQKSQGNLTPAEATTNAARSETLWKFHKNLSKEAPDLSLGSVVAMCNARLMVNSPTAYGVLAEMEPVMSAAGIIRDS